MTNPIRIALIAGLLLTLGSGALRAEADGPDLYSISRADGVTYDLKPVGDAPGNFRDQKGGAVHRESGLGSDGQIFRFQHESVFVYWETATPKASKADNATAPFATRHDGGDFDATTLLPCKAAEDSEYGDCPAGIMRMDNRQAPCQARNAVLRALSSLRLRGSGDA